MLERVFADGVVGRVLAQPAKPRHCKCLAPRRFAIGHRPRDEIRIWARTGSQQHVAPQHLIIAERADEFGFLFEREQDIADVARPEVGLSCRFLSRIAATVAVVLPPRAALIPVPGGGGGGAPAPTAGVTVAAAAANSRSIFSWMLSTWRGRLS